MEKTTKNTNETGMVKMKKSVINNKTRQYIEAVIYILAIIVVILSNNYCDIYIRMVPLLFILGIVGKVIFDRPVITTIFGIIVSVCVVKISSNASDFVNLIISFSAGLHIALGELIGEYGEKIYKIIKNKKNIKNKKVLSTYIIAIAIVLISATIHIYINGNVITYERAKQSLNNYLTEQYGKGENLKILRSEYAFLNKPNYSFEVRNTKKGFTSKYIIYLNNISKVEDEYKKEIIDKNNNDLMSEFIQYLSSKKYDLSLKFSIKYLEDNNIEVDIYKSVDSITNEEKDKFSEECGYFIKDLNQFKRYNSIENVNVTIDNKNNSKDILTSIINVKDFENKTNDKVMDPKQYILKSFDIDIIDF